MNLGQVIKKMAVEAVESRGPLQYIEGEVVSSPPDLQIRLKNNPKLIIPSDFIRVPERLKKHKRKVNITSSDISDSMTSAGYTSHTHDIQSLTMRNTEIEFLDELKTGDKVMVAVVQGGQSFFIVDRF